VQDQERRRIARELHDGLGQLLAAAKMNVSHVLKEKDKLSVNTARHVEENSQLIEEALTEIRTLSYLLHPPLLDELGLPSALRTYIDGFAERSKISVTLQLSSDLGDLPKDQELCVFRVAQECLTNIHRHSGSATALVRLSRSSSHIELEIKDHGRGLPEEIRSKIASGVSAGVGFRGMQERVTPSGWCADGSVQRKWHIRCRGAADCRRAVTKDLHRTNRVIGAIIQIRSLVRGLVAAIRTFKFPVLQGN
jgi:signal transduction histidine kinase